MNRTTGVHPFELAGLGHAPFRVVRLDRNAGKCMFCGTRVLWRFHVRDARAKEFFVGSSCVQRSDSGSAKALEWLAVCRHLGENFYGGQCAGCWMPVPARTGFWAAGDVYCKACTLEFNPAARERRRENSRCAERERASQPWWPTYLRYMASVPGATGAWKWIQREYEEAYAAAKGRV